MAAPANDCQTIKSVLHSSAPALPVFELSKAQILPQTLQKNRQWITGELDGSPPGTRARQPHFFDAVDAGD